jgi:serine/threonine protein kinase
MAVNEYQILAKLDHPNILKLYEVFHDDQTKEVSIVTEFI